MAGFLQKALRGAADTGSKLYANQAQAELKDRIMSARDDRLNSFKTSAAETSREFTKSERIAEQAFTSEENRKKLEAQGGKFSDRYTVVGGQLFDKRESNKQGKEVWIDVPSNSTEIKKLAAKMAKDSMGDFPDIPEGTTQKQFYDETFNGYMEMLGGIKAESKGTGTPKPAPVAEDKWADFTPRNLEELQVAIKGGISKERALELYDKLEPKKEAPSTPVTKEPAESKEDRLKRLLAQPGTPEERFAVTKKWIRGFMGRDQYDKFLSNLPESFE